MLAHGFRFYFTPLLGDFSPFPHGTGPLSVTGSYFALADGPASFDQDFSCPGLLRKQPQTPPTLTPTGLSPPPVRLSRRFGFRLLRPGRSADLPGPLLQPRAGNGCRLLSPHGLGSSPFARRYWGNHMLFPLPPGTEMFQFPGFASSTLCVQMPDDRPLGRPGCPIRTSADQRLRAAPRGFSQLTTSFFAGLCPGIHRAPSLA